MRGETYLILLFIIHKRSNGPTLIGAGPGLTANTDGGTANPKMVGRTRNSAEGGRHLVRMSDRGDNQSG